MFSAIKQFRDNIERIRELGGVYDALCHLTAPVLDATDLLRAQIVLAVSALDHYIHEIARVGMLEALHGTRPRTDAFLRFQVSMETTLAGLEGGNAVSLFEAEIRQRHGYQSFQMPDKIAEAVRLFSASELWPSVASRLGLSVRDVKDHLSLIVDRRNKIAHEADLDPSYPGTRWPISRNDVSGTIDFIERLCEAVHETVK